MRACSRAFSSSSRFSTVASSGSVSTARLLKRPVSVDSRERVTERCGLANCRTYSSAPNVSGDSS